MNQKSVMITGAASGIGRETALLFAQKGWFVGIFDVNEKGLKTLEAEIGKDGCFSQTMDVTRPESVKAGIEAFMEKTGGRMDLLLNNAGIIKFGLFENVGLEVHSRIVDVNFKGCLNCIFYAFRYLKQTPGSRIINMSSGSAFYGLPDLSVYSATKHALSAMTEALNIEFERHGIFVCDIRPPYVRTPLIDVPEEVYSFKTLRILMGPEYVAKRIWRAAHRRKLHWNIGVMPVFGFLIWLLPFLKRSLVKLLVMPPK